MTKREFYIEIEKLGIKKETAYNYMYVHKELSFEEVLEYYRNKKSIIEKRKSFGVSCSTISYYRKKHPELTDEQIIELFLNS